jgi:uncharacterized membrane protein HdeD (DUF308 family)
MLSTPALPHRFWWIRLVIGMMAIGIGLLALAWPDATVAVIAVLFGLNLLAGGCLWVLEAILTPAGGLVARLGYGLLGLISVVFGVLCLRHLLQTVTVLVLLVGLFWLIEGILQLIVTLAAGPPSRWTASTVLDLLAGGVAVVAGTAVLVYPDVSVKTLVVLVGLSLIACGIAVMVDSLRLRSRASTP